MARYPGVQVFRPPDGSRQRVPTADERGKVNSIPDTVMSEGLGSGGTPLDEQRYGMYRSPGMFAVRLGQDGKSVVIGEPWVGPSDDSAEGGMEGCSADSPGLLFTADGKAMPIGGETTKTAATMAAEAGGVGRILLVFLCPPPGTVGTVVYRAVPVAGGIGANRGVWADIKSWVPVGYAAWYTVPIALLKISLSSGSYYVDDIYWTAEQPAISVGGGSAVAGAGSLVRVTGVAASTPYYVGALYSGVNNVTMTSIYCRFPGISYWPAVPTMGWAYFPYSVGISASVNLTLGGVTRALYDVVGIMLVS